MSKITKSAEENQLKAGDVKSEATVTSELTLIEEEELKIGGNFHAFRFNSLVTDPGDELSLIEEEELKIGSNFHAFRFNSLVTDPVDELWLIEGDDRKIDSEL
jgi:hypothetical protein